MPIILEANYSKKLGLPNFSSHSYSVTLKTELTDLSQVQKQSAELYSLIQAAVDKELTQVGFLPDATTYGMNGTRNGSHPGNGTNGTAGQNPDSADGHAAGNGQNDSWSCSDKQRDLILKIVKDNNLDKKEIESLAEQLFGVGVKECNKLQASQLIEELFEKTGKKSNGRTRWRRPARA